MNILITGGAGFIGSRLAKMMASRGNQVTVLDNLTEQVHGSSGCFPDELASVARCVLGDVCDQELVAQELADTEVVVHLAAETGTGQSMYRVGHYAQVNVQGTATIIDVVVNNRPQRLRKFVVASSRAVYGEGKYRCQSHGVVYPRERSSEAMSAGKFEASCPECGGEVHVLPTTENAPFAPSSFYGLSKQVQEQMVLMFGNSLGLDAIALRYQNVYGPGQSLSNPYTGLLAVFCNLVRQNKALTIFEDGLESRDFVYIDDVIEATAACISPTVRGIHVANVGSGIRTTVLEVASAIRTYLRSDVPVRVTGEYRLGDIRHNAADITRIRELTGFQPHWGFKDGLNQFLSWAETRAPAEAGFEHSIEELRKRGFLASPFN